MDRMCCLNFQSWFQDLGSGGEGIAALSSGSSEETSKARYTYVGVLGACLLLGVALCAPCSVPRVDMMWESLFISATNDLRQSVR